MIICADDSNCTRECMRLNASQQKASMSSLGFMPYRQQQVAVGACFGMKGIGKPCTGKLFARFDEGGLALPALYSTHELYASPVI